jgi:hypothetical protein
MGADGKCDICGGNNKKPCPKDHEAPGKSYNAHGCLAGKVYYVAMGLCHHCGWFNKQPCLPGFAREDFPVNVDGCNAGRGLMEGTEGVCTHCGGVKMPPCRGSAREGFKNDAKDYDQAGCERGFGLTPAGICDRCGRRNQVPCEVTALPADSVHPENHNGWTNHNGPAQVYGLDGCKKGLALSAATHKCL